MNRLYPLKFRPIIKDKIWGGKRLSTVLHKKCKSDKAGESWEISGFPGNISRVSNGFLKGNSLEELIEVYMGDLVGDGVFETFGTLFPLLIKFIDANDALSVQVHPNDEMARQHFASYGKTEMWYILEADKDAEIIVGFNQPVNREMYRKNLADKTLLSILNKEKVAAGDVFFLPAGRIHAIGSGILLAEIQQTSDATLRIYDYDRLDDRGKPRELHTETALETIDFKPVTDFKTPYRKNPDKPVNLVMCPYFTVNFLDLSRSADKDYITLDSFVILMCIGGSFTIRYSGAEEELVKLGETVLLPAEMKHVQLIPDHHAQILEVYIEGLAVTNRSEDILDSLF
jgi:mannose-6-phosphate isomerase